jgi:opacity protein-like surface antigen
MKPIMPALIALLVAFLLAPRIVAAEPYAGLFVGGAMSRDTDVDRFSATFENVEIDHAIVFGGKTGFFFDTPVLGGNAGLELEVYHFRPHIDSQTVDFSATGFSGTTTFHEADLHITAIALNALYRFPLARTPEFPRGRLHPYVGVGLGAFIARLEGRTSVLDEAIELSDTDVQPGVQALAGGKFFMTPHLALFAEYKFVHTAEFTFNRMSDFGTRGGVRAFEVSREHFDLTTHMFQAGIAYHW